MSAPVRLLLMFGALLLCHLELQVHAVAELRAGTLFLATASRASVLVSSSTTIAGCTAGHGSARSCLGTPARTGHHPDFPGRSGPGFLAGSGLPYPSVPAPPAPPPSHPTSFQEARYQQAVRQYQGVVRRAWAALRRQQQQELATWAKSTVAKAESVRYRTALRPPASASTWV